MRKSLTTSFRHAPTDRALINALMQRLGKNQSQAIVEAVRREAQRLGVALVEDRQQPAQPREAA